MTGCIFCKILAGQAPASRIVEDETCLAFMDLFPVNPGHALVIPKRHVILLGELADEETARLFQMGRRVNLALRACGIRCEGVNMLVADGPAAGQEVPHAHLHVLPRFAGDGFGFRRAIGSGGTVERASLDRLAKAIAEGLDAKEGQ